MEVPAFSVVVPASTANLGPGFDSMGMALGLYMTVNVSKGQNWQVTYEEEEFKSLATDESNLIVQTILKVAEQYGKTVSPLSMTVQSDTPLGKGLGSSATAIAAGIEIANHLLHLNMSSNEKVKIGSELEGHVDNVSAALLGGVTISHYDGEEIDLVHVQNPQVGAVILVPPKALKTEESRGLLPEQLVHKEATRSSAASCVLAAAIVRDDWEMAGKMMEKDVFHEPYRKVLFQDFDEIRNVCKEVGTYGMTISGAGPSLFIAVKKDSEEEVAAQLREHFPFYECLPLQPSSTGTMVK